jgi:hypothetical protein
MLPPKLGLNQRISPIKMDMVCRVNSHHHVDTGCDTYCDSVPRLLFGMIEEPI